MSLAPSTDAGLRNIPTEKETLWEILCEERRCPDCGAQDSMGVTAKGGLSLNIQCGNCGSHFWVSPAKCLGAERL